MWRDKRRFAAQSKRNSNRSAPIEAAGAGEAFWVRTLDETIFCSEVNGCPSTHTRRCWRPAWWQSDGCPTSTTIKRSSARPDATAGWAFALPAACGRGKGDGRDARLNLCLLWRVTLTCPQFLLNDTSPGASGTALRVSAVDRKWNEKNKDELFVQKIKNVY